MSTSLTKDCFKLTAAQEQRIGRLTREHDVTDLTIRISAAFADELYVDWQEIVWPNTAPQVLMRESTLDRRGYLKTYIKGKLSTFLSDTD